MAKNIIKGSSDSDWEVEELKERIAELEAQIEEIGNNKVKGIKEAELAEYRPFYDTRLNDPKHTIPKTIRFTHQDVSDISTICKAKESPEFQDFGETVRGLMREEKRRWFDCRDFSENPKLQVLKEMLAATYEIEIEEIAKDSLVERMRVLIIVSPVIAGKIAKKIIPKLDGEMQDRITELLNERCNKLTSRSKLSKGEKELYKKMFTQISQEINEIEM